jgi:hypothetical protein
MIYLESNIDAHIGYNISDTSSYNAYGRTNIVSNRTITGLCQQLIRLLEAIDRKTIKDTMRLMLLPLEVVHIQNLYFKTNGDHIKQLDTDDISNTISVIDNVILDNIRLIVINNHEFYGDRHYSILKHNDVIFEKYKDLITIFVDEAFLVKKDNQEIMELIFNCVDYFVSDASKVSYNVFSEHPLALDKKFAENPEELTTIYDDLSPKMIFRNRLSTTDIMFMAEYLVVMCYHLRKWFALTEQEIDDLFFNYPIFKFFKRGYGVSIIIEEIMISIEDNLDGSLSELERAINCEYKVAEEIRNRIMNMPYED